MRDRVMLLLLVLALPALAQWQADQRLTNNAAESYTTNNNAWAVAANGNTVHVVWFDNRSGSFQIYYQRSDDAGVTWLSTPTQLTNSTGHKYFPAVAVSGSVVHVVWQDYYNGTATTYYERYDGTTWGSPVPLSSGTSEAENPSIAVNGSDVWVVWDQYVSSTNYKIYYNHSTNGGTGWGSATALSSGTNYSYLPSVAISGNYVHFVWEDNRQTGHKEQVYYNRYNTTNSSWLGDVSISKGSNYSLGPCVAAAGAYVNVVWHDYRSGKWNIYDQRSTDNGGTWKASDDYLTSNTVGYTELPNLAASGTNVWGVWDGNSSGDFEIDCNNSTDYGANWIVDRRLTNCDGCSEYPSVAVSGTNVHVVWQDNRAGNYEIYYKRCMNPLSLGWFQKPTSGTDFRAFSWVTYNTGSGSVYAGHGYTDFFDRFNIASDTWAGRNPWYTPGAGSCACADGSLYVYAALGGCRKYFRFAVNNNLWAPMESVPTAIGSGGSCVFTTGGKTLLLTGTVSTLCYLYQFTPGSGIGSWAARDTPPAVTSWGAGSWLAYDNVNNLVYALAATSNSLYKYDVKGDSWFTPTLASLPATPGVGGCGAFLNGRIYALRGNGTNEFYSYNIAANGWARLENVPTPSGDAMNVGDGASITTNGQSLYVEKGNSSYRLYQYVPGGTVFGSAPTPIVGGVTAQIVCDTSFAIVPNPLVSGFATLSFTRPLESSNPRFLLSVYNVSGQTVLTQALAVGCEASGVSLDLHHLTNGVYVMRLTSDGFAGTQKLVVRR
jgi:hypothetical protein